MFAFVSAVMITAVLLRAIAYGFTAPRYAEHSDAISRSSIE
jgi:hypothetical protein